MLFFLLIKVEIPTIVGISTFMTRENFMLSWVEHEKSFITLVPGVAGVFGCVTLKLHTLTGRRLKRKSEKDTCRNGNAMFQVSKWRLADISRHCAPNHKNSIWLLMPDTLHGVTYRRTDSLSDWLVGCYGLNGPLRQYFTLYLAVSQREGEREEKW